MAAPDPRSVLLSHEERSLSSAGPDAIGEAVVIELREIECQGAECSRVFLLCRKDDRGQRYCSKWCRRRAREESVHRARLSYARKDKGRENNRQRQRRFRARWGSAGRAGKVKTVTDHTSQPGGDEARWEGVAASSTPEEEVAEVDAGTESSVAYVPRGYEPERCSVCGRPGVVVRRRSGRGRFRWGSRRRRQGGS